MKKYFQNLAGSDFFKTFKEELISVPGLVFIFYVINRLLVAIFPHSAFFDFFSEIETIASKIVIFFVGVWVSHLSLRIFFPAVYKTLHEDFYHAWGSISPEKRIDYAVKFILVLMLVAGLVFGAKAESSVVRTKLMVLVNQQVGVKEVPSGSNRGPEVDKYLKSVGVNQPAAWCAAFVSYNLQVSDIPNPKSAWSPNYALSKDVIWKQKLKTSLEPLPGDVAAYYYQNLGRVGHVGFFESKDKDGYFITIEGNTNGAGSREGEGVYKKKRSPSKVYAISRYIK